MTSRSLLVSAVLLLTCALTRAETVHQSLDGSAAHLGEGGKALAAGVLETRTIAHTEVARIGAAMNQWGFVTYWMGRPTPPGRAVIRVTVFNTGEKVALYSVYIAGAANTPLGNLTIPADAPKNRPVNIDIPVDQEKEWSGVILKKFSPDPLPGPWIQAVSVVLPDTR